MTGPVTLDLEAYCTLQRWRDAGWSPRRLGPVIGVDPVTLRKAADPCYRFQPGSARKIEAWAQANPQPSPPPHRLHALDDDMARIVCGWLDAGWSVAQLATATGVSKETVRRAKQPGARLEGDTHARITAWAADHRTPIPPPPHASKHATPSPDRRFAVDQLEAATGVIFPEHLADLRRAGYSIETLAARYHTSTARIADLLRRDELARQLGVARKRHHNLQEAS